MSNTILGYFYNGSAFAGYLAIDAQGAVVFGYDCDWAQSNSYDCDGDIRSSYMVYTFPSQEEALATLEDWGYR